MANIDLNKTEVSGPSTVDQEILDFAQDDTFRFEEQAPRSGFIALISVGMLGFIVFAMFALTGYWNWYLDSTTNEANNSSVGTQLKELRVREETELSGYGYVDQGKGVVRVPIAEAMKAITSEAAAGKYREGIQLIPLTAAATASAAAPAAGAAPAASPAPSPAASPAASPSAAPAKAAAAASATKAAPKPAAPAQH
ncbi:MAG: hypothetical protein ACKV2V_25165 [Blastocatellia bacterium]